MPIKYVGRVNDFCGKPLFYYLGRLKDFGKGRIVYRQRFTRYSRPSYYRITRVQPDMSNLELSYNGCAWGEYVCQGEKVGEGKIYHPYKADWRLVPKDEEEAFLAQDHGHKEKNIVPSHIEYPPLLEYLMRKEAERKGQPLTEKPMLKFKVLNPKNAVQLEVEKYKEHLEKQGTKS